MAGSTGPGGIRQSRYRPAVRRPAPARGPGPLAGHRAADPAARRAAECPRRAPQRAHAGRADRAAEGPRHHLRLCHPQPVGSLRHGRPRGDHEPRTGRAGRHAAGRVPRAAQPLRRRVRRRQEHPRRQRRRLRRIRAGTHRVGARRLPRPSTERAHGGGRRAGERLSGRRAHPARRTGDSAQPSGVPGGR
ncbi:hypothetical protein D3C76_1250430 [compost metagenome]